MKTINTYINEKLVLNKDNIRYYASNYHPKDKDDLIDLTRKLIHKRGNDADLNDIDTSNITDMSVLFFGSEFNGDISRWNVSNVTNMNSMFRGSKFNGDISKWNVSNVKYMPWMFKCSTFNQDISSWDVSNVEDMENMFFDCPLEFNPPKWYKK